VKPPQYRGPTSKMRVIAISLIFAAAFTFGARSDSLIHDDVVPEELSIRSLEDARAVAAEGSQEQNIPTSTSDLTTLIAKTAKELQSSRARSIRAKVAQKERAAKQSCTKAMCADKLRKFKKTMALYENYRKQQLTSIAGPGKEKAWKVRREQQLADAKQQRQEALASKHSRPERQVQTRLVVEGIDDDDFRHSTKLQAAFKDSLAEILGMPHGDVHITAIGGHLLPQKTVDDPFDMADILLQESTSADDVIAEAERMISDADEVMSQAHGLLSSDGTSPEDTMIASEASASQVDKAKPQRAKPQKAKPPTPRAEVAFHIETDRDGSKVLLLALDSVLRDPAKTGLDKAFAQATKRRGVSLKASPTMAASAMPTVTCLVSDAADSLPQAQPAEQDQEPHTAAQLHSMIQRTPATKKAIALKMAEPQHELQKGLQAAAAQADLQTGQKQKQNVAAKETAQATATEGAKSKATSKEGAKKKATSKQGAKAKDKSEGKEAKSNGLGAVVDAVREDAKSKHMPQSKSDIPVKKLQFKPDLSKPMAPKIGQKQKPQKQKHVKQAPKTKAPAPHSNQSSSDDTWWIALLVIFIIIVLGVVVFFVFYKRYREQKQLEEEAKERRDALRRRGMSLNDEATQLCNRMQEMLMNRAPVTLVAPVREELRMQANEAQALISQYHHEQMSNEAGELQQLVDHLNALSEAPDTGPAAPDDTERMLVEAMQANIEDLLRNAVAASDAKMQAGQITEPPSLQNAKRQLALLSNQRAERERQSAAGCFGGCKSKPPQRPTQAQAQQAQRAQQAR